MNVSTRLIAAGFACGSAAHAAGFVLLLGGLELYGTGYPASRRVLMALIDGSIVLIALGRAKWLVFALIAFVIEQCLVN